MKRTQRSPLFTSSWCLLLLLSIPLVSLAQNCPYPLGQAVTSDYSSTLAVDGNYAYLATNYDGLQIFDVSDLRSPELVGGIPITRISRCLDVSEELAYIGHSYYSDRYFEIIDVSNPIQPVSMAEITLGDIPFRLVHQGDYVFIANDGEGLVVIDVSDPSLPDIVDNYPCHQALDLDLQGEMVFIADFDRGLRIIDISDPHSDLEQIAFLPTDCCTRAVSVWDQYAYILDNDWMQVVDISNPQSPQIVGTLSGLSSASDLFATGNHLFVSQEEEGLIVIDVSQPDQPFIALHEPELTGFQKLEIENSVLYTAAGYEGLRTIWIRCADTEPIYEEAFDHNGTMPPGWSIESHSTRGDPWSPLQDSGEDWSIVTGHTQYGNSDDEWLISPVFDLSSWVECELNFWQDYNHHLSQATLRYSNNSGASWNTLTASTESTSGYQLFDISGWADDLSSVRFLFIFSGEFLSDGAYWNIDDFWLSGTSAYDDLPPVVSEPVPAQPMEGHWSDLTGFIGCTMIDPSGVDASSVAVRIDANGDGDYSDGGPEDWTPVAGLTNSDTLEVLTAVTYIHGLPGMAFEFRGKDLSSTNSLYGYSGLSNLEGINDDWTVDIAYDVSIPEFSNPIPGGQPEPPWIDNQTVTVGCTVLDSIGFVDAVTLAMRIDLNQDLDYNDTGEDWSSLFGYASAGVIEIEESISFPCDGGFHVEFQAADTSGNGLAYSMADEGIVDDILIRIDTTPPSAPYLIVESSTETNAVLMFSPTDDLTFSRYEVYVSEDSLVDETDRLWTDVDDPGLGERDTYTTTVTGLVSGTPYWFRMRTIDGLGHIGNWSNTVHYMTEGTPLAAITDLNIELVEGGLSLTWSEPTEDENGNTPVFIQGYDIHSSIDPHFTPTTETKIATVTTNSFSHEVELSGGTFSYYRVVALGCGSSYLPFTYIPAGSFTMGQNSVEEPEHEVTLTHDFYLATHEVTNQDYLIAVQWAYDNNYVSIYGNVYAHGEELLILSTNYQEISFNDGVFSLVPVVQGYYAGESSADHPVKSVTWYGAACYCDWLSEMEGLTPFYQGDWDQDLDHNPYVAEGYRLPTEAEWEYAARYYDSRRYPWGDESPNCDYANYQGCVGWTAPVGSHPNGNSHLGLQDMSGNLFEWVGDWSDTYSSSPQTNPLGGNGEYRVMRGGSWVFGMSFLQCAYRLYVYPFESMGLEGIRPARTVNP